MHFKQLAIPVLFLLCSCGPASDYENETNYEVGRKPELYNAAYLWGANDDQNVVLIDRSGHTLQHFQLEPFSHTRSIDLPLDVEEQGILASVGATYFVTIAEDNYAIVKPNGDVEINPVELLGTIETAAFDPENHVLVLADSFRSLALMVLTNDGTVQGTWKAGSLFTEEKYIVSGTMLTDGRLVLALEGGTIAIVNVAQSVADQAWSYESFDVADADLFSWIAAVPDNEDVILLTDDSNIYAIDISQKTVLDKVAPENTTIGKYRDYSPHIVTRSSGEIITVYYLGTDQKITSQSMRGPDSYAITQSYLDPDSSMITVVYDPNSTTYSGYSTPYYYESEVYRFRLSDNLALDKTTLSDKVNLVVTPNYLLMLHESILGKATRSTYGKTPDRHTLESYNLESVRKKYQESL